MSEERVYKTSEKDREKSRRSKVKHRDRILAELQVRRDTDPEYREKQNARRREHYAKNRETEKAKFRVYREKNLDEVRRRGAISARKRRAKNQGLSTESHRKSRLGITQVQVNTLLDQQGFSCSICGHPDGTGGLKNKRLHVDHCHRTKLIRRMLCHHCNIGLGMFKDSLGLLRKAQQYLLDQCPQPTKEHKHNGPT